MSWDDLLSDYDGRDLPFSAPFGKPSQSAPFVDVQSVGKNAKELKLYNLYRCPAENVIPNDPIFMGNHYFYRSYSLNRARTTSNMAGMGIYNLVKPVTLPQIQKPSHTIMIGENRGCYSRMGGNSSGEILDNPYSGPLTSANNPSRIGHLQPNSLGYLPVETPLHHNQWNYLFCDGHVQSLVPSATVGPGVPVNGDTDSASMWWK